MGKALSGGTQILTPDGFVLMEDIQVGENVYDSNGKLTKVTFKTDVQYNRTCYKVKFIHGEEIIADADHEWMVIDKSGEEELYTTEQLLHYKRINARHTSGIKINLAPAVPFDKKEVPIDPYTLGVWLGDGFSISNKITTHIDDYEEFSKLLMTEGMKFRKNSTTCFDFKLTDITCAMLKENDLYKNKHIPKDYIFNDFNTRLELLRGLMDTDGSVEKNGVCRFYQSDLNMIKDVRLLLSSLGIKSTLKSKETIGKMAYRLCFTTSDFDVFKLPRKLERQHINKQNIKNKRFYLDYIEQIESEPVYCIEVDSETHMFLAGETLIPTHNCTLGDTRITVRNKRTGEVMEIEMSELLDRVSDETDNR